MTRHSSHFSSLTESDKQVVGTYSQRLIYQLMDIQLSHIEKKNVPNQGSWHPVIIPEVCHLSQKRIVLAIFQHFLQAQQDGGRREIFKLVGGGCWRSQQATLNLTLQSINIVNSLLINFSAWWGCGGQPQCKTSFASLIQIACMIQCMESTTGAREEMQVV